MMRKERTRMHVALFTAVMLCVLSCSDNATTNESGDASTYRAMSFNIRYANPNDGEHRWDLRKDWVAEIVSRSEADVVGLQEALRHQIDTLAARLPAYGWVGQGRDDGRDAGEFSPILYRRDRLTLETTGTFWLSPTPSEPGSSGWDAALPRIVTWALFTDRDTGYRFYHFNTHFDHVGEEARAESARLIRRKALELAPGAAFVVTGDFNATPESIPYAEMTRDQSGMTPLVDSRTVADEQTDLTTYRGFTTNSGDGRTIDYVFSSPDFEIVRHRVLDDTRGNAYPSDHLPVVADLKVRQDAGR